MVTFRICVVSSNDRSTAECRVADAGPETIPRMNTPNKNTNVQELDIDRVDIEQV